MITKDWSRVANNGLIHSNFGTNFFPIEKPRGNVKSVKEFPTIKCPQVDRCDPNKIIHYIGTWNIEPKIYIGISESFVLSEMVCSFFITASCRAYKSITINQQVSFMLIELMHPDLSLSLCLCLTHPLCPKRNLNDSALNLRHACTHVSVCVRCTFGARSSWMCDTCWWYCGLFSLLFQVGTK